MSKDWKTYRIYGDDNDCYWNGGPLFDSIYLITVKAKDKESAVRKGLRWSRKNRKGWLLRDLSARALRSN